MAFVFNNAFAVVFPVSIRIESSVKNNTRKLQAFHDKLACLKFLDPVCGTGNFLIIAYRELRRLEIKVLELLIDIRDGIILVMFRKYQQDKSI